MSDFSGPHRLTREEAAGMTVNERLWAAGLSEDYEDAIKSNDEEKFRGICDQLFLGSENVQVLVNKYFKG